MRSKLTTHNHLTDEQKLTSVQPFRRTFALGLAVLAVSFGILIIFKIHAAGPSPSIQPENGSKSASIVTGADATASGGSYVQFKAAAVGGGGGGKFSVDGSGIIHNPAGGVFVPMGANIGPTWCQWGLIAGGGTGQSAAAQAWNWNTVRLNIWGGACPSEDATAVANTFIDEYTAKNIVVIVSDHDLTNGPGSGWTQSQVLAWLGPVAARNKNNPYVWYNCYNEPPVDSTTYVNYYNQCIDTIRGNGVTSPLVIDGDGSSTSANWDGTPRQFDACAGFRAHDPQQNVIMSLHNYDNFDIPIAAPILSNFIDMVRAHSCALIVGEFGASDDGSEWVAGNHQKNYDSAVESMRVAPGKGVAR
jgi:hypothetical protein